MIFFSVSYIIIMLYNLLGFMPSFGKIGFTFPVRNFLRRKILCRCVGIGRRGGLKILCQRWRVGSNPTTGTIFVPSAFAGGFLFGKNRKIIVAYFSVNIKPSAGKIRKFCTHRYFSLFFRLFMQKETGVQSPVISVAPFCRRKTA